LLIRKPCFWVKDYKEKKFVCQSKILLAFTTEVYPVNLNDKMLMPFFLIKQENIHFVLIISVPLSLKSARPGAIRLFIIGLDYTLFQLRLLKHTGLVIGLGQGMTSIQEESKILYQPKGRKKEREFYPSTLNPLQECTLCPLRSCGLGLF